MVWNDPFLFSALLFLLTCLCFPPHAHCRAADFRHCFVHQEISLPFRVIKGFLHNKRNEPLGFNLTKSFEEYSKPFYFYFSIRYHSSSSLINVTGSVTLIS